MKTTEYITNPSNWIELNLNKCSAGANYCCNFVQCTKSIDRADIQTANNATVNSGKQVILMNYTFDLMQLCFDIDEIQDEKNK